MSDAHDNRPAHGLESQLGKTQPSTKHRPSKLLLVDRDPALRTPLERCAFGPATVLYAESIAKARVLLHAEGPVDVAIIDPDLDDGSGLDFAQELTAGTSPTQAVVVSGSDNFDLAMHAMRAGASDFLVKQTGAAELIDAALLAERVRAAITRREAAHEQQRRIRRLKKLCKRLDTARAEVSDQVDILCNDLVTAYQELAVQMQDAVQTSGFTAIIDGELDLETVLRKTLEHLVSKAGPCNAAIFLPASMDEYSLGGYVNYDCPKESADMLLQHLADVLAPRIGEHDQLVHVRDNAAMQVLMGDDWHYLADSRLITFACVADDEPLAVVALFRDENQPFPDGLEETCRTVADVLGETLSRIIRVHHRATPDEVFGDATTDELLGEDTFLPHTQWDGYDPKQQPFGYDEDEQENDDRDEDLPF